MQTLNIKDYLENFNFTPSPDASISGTRTLLDSDGLTLRGLRMLGVNNFIADNHDLCGMVRIGINSNPILNGQTISQLANNFVIESPNLPIWFNTRHPSGIRIQNVGVRGNSLFAESGTNFHLQPRHRFRINSHGQIRFTLNTTANRDTLPNVFTRQIYAVTRQAQVVITGQNFNDQVTQTIGDNIDRRMLVNRTTGNIRFATGDGTGNIRSDRPSQSGIEVNHLEISNSATERRLSFRAEGATNRDILLNGGNLRIRNGADDANLFTVTEAGTIGGSAVLSAARITGGSSSVGNDNGTFRIGSLRVIWGRTTVAGSNNLGTSRHGWRINFGHTFSHRPNIQISTSSAAFTTGGGPGPLTGISVSDVTTSNVEFTVHRSNTTGTVIYWIATGNQN